VQKPQAQPALTKPTMAQNWMAKCLPMGENPPFQPKRLATLALHIDAKACRIIPAQNAPQPKEGGCIKHAKTKMRFASKGRTVKTTGHTKSAYQIQLD
jgi:hypothetical protein